MDTNNISIEEKIKMAKAAYMRDYREREKEKILNIQDRYWFKKYYEYKELGKI